MQRTIRFVRSTAQHNIAASSRSARRLWPIALMGLLLICFLMASPHIYDWARQTAKALPNVAPADLPRVALTGQPQVSDQTGPILMAQRTSAQTTLPDPAQLTVPLERPEIPEADPITMLLLGVDQRPDDPSPPRTDNIIVLTYDPVSNKGGMISLPRDLFVSIPGFDRSGKINTAYVVGESNDYPGGGSALAKKTVSEFLGYPIDYYVKINFDGFKQVVDLIGGVDVVVPKTIHDDEYPTIDYGYMTFHIDAGPQHLDGDTALMYVRTRNTDSDFERARRQQQVLMAVKDTVLQNKLLATLRVPDLLEIISQSVEHDIPTTDLLDLLAMANKVQIDQIDQLVLDTQYGTVDADSPYGWIVLPDRDKIRPAVDKIFARAEAPVRPKIDVEALVQQQIQQQAELARQQVRNDYQAQAETLRQQLAAEDARIVVYDGTGDPVLAARTANWLESQGYNIVEFGQAERADYPRTVLLKHNDKPFTEANLRGTFAIAKDNIRQSDNADSSVDLRLIIGRDFYLLVSN